MKDLLTSTKHKRIIFLVLAIAVAVADHFGFADYTLETNIAVIITAGVPLILSMLRKYFDV